MGRDNSSTCRKMRGGGGQRSKAILVTMIMIESRSSHHRHYVSRRFPEVKEVRDLVASNEINYKLLEAVSERIELGVADVVSMFRLQSEVQAGSDE
jgi:hypothetical protein